MCRTRECTVPVHPLHLYTLGVKSMPEIPQKLWAILIFPLHKVKSYPLGDFGKIGALIGVIIGGRRTIIVLVRVSLSEIISWELCGLMINVKQGIDRYKQLIKFPLGKNGELNEKIKVSALWSTCIYIQLYK